MQFSQCLSSATWHASARSMASAHCFVLFFFFIIIKSVLLAVHCLASVIYRRHMFGYEFTRTFYLTCNNKTCYGTPLKMCATAPPRFTAMGQRERKCSAEALWLQTASALSAAPHGGSCHSWGGVGPGCPQGPGSCFQSRPIRKPWTQLDLPSPSHGSQPIPVPTEKALNVTVKPHKCNI